MSQPAIMTTYRWTTDYAVGVHQIDEEHRRLFVLAEEMHQALLQGKGVAVLGQLLDSLVEYTRYHFAQEEQLMQRLRYPGYARHRQQHEALTANVLALQGRAASGEVTMTIEAMQFLIAWLKHHTIASDRQIGDYIMQTGAS